MPRVEYTSEEQEQIKHEIKEPRLLGFVSVLSCGSLQDMLYRSALTG